MHTDTCNTIISSVQTLTHQADRADDHVGVRFRRPLLLPEQVPNHRSRCQRRCRIISDSTGDIMTVVKASVLVDETLAELVPLLGQAGEPPPRPSKVQQP